MVETQADIIMAEDVLEVTRLVAVVIHPIRGVTPLVVEAVVVEEIPAAAGVVAVRL